MRRHWIRPYVPVSVVHAVVAPAAVDADAPAAVPNLDRLFGGGVDPE
ncbi:MAG: hypothetical protein KF861_24030 [Planctomycetaceae bacterium]|nr:hypothetical protein [Planctomycetaceae bacterium]